LWVRWWTCEFLRHGGSYTKKHFQICSFPDLIMNITFYDGDFIVLRYCAV
jgi:hypothetical protein